MCLPMKGHTTTYSPAKGVKHKSDQVSGSSVNLQDMQRRKEQAELYHSYAASKIQTIGHYRTTAPGSSIDNP